MRSHRAGSSCGGNCGVMLYRRRRAGPWAAGRPACSHTEHLLALVQCFWARQSIQKALELPRAHAFIGMYNHALNHWGWLLPLLISSQSLAGHATGPVPSTEALPPAPLHPPSLRPLSPRAPCQWAEQPCWRCWH